MTQLLDHALAATRTLPPMMQDGIARVILRLTGADDEVIALSPDERAAVALSKSAAACDGFATDAEIQAIWSKYNL